MAKTIIDPKEFYSKLLGKQIQNGNDTFRLMKYVVRVDHEDGVLLYNVITGQLVLLSSEEQTVVDALPAGYTPLMDELIRSHYLVAMDFDECSRVVQIRNVLNIIEERKKSPIGFYTILPTTACNARCFYCFEADVETVTMTKETADDTVEFIKRHYEGKEIRIRWFGGEPTVAYKLINRISEGLQSAGVLYSSQMISNGYLFDADMIMKAAELWKLYQIQITLDGTEALYNKVKSYVNVTDNPYQRVLNNIQMLLNQGIHVSIRMNLDRYNESDLKNLLKELNEKFGREKNLTVYAWPVFGECGYEPVHHDEEDKRWLLSKLTEFNKLCEFYGFFHSPDVELPTLKYRCCMADNDTTIVVRPGGELMRCLERFESDNVVGNVKDGITDQKVYREWKTQIVADICRECSLFPQCVRLDLCGSPSDSCFKKSIHGNYEQNIVSAYENRKDREYRR